MASKWPRGRDGSIGNAHDEASNRNEHALKTAPRPVGEIAMPPRDGLRRHNYAMRSEKGPDVRRGSPSSGR